eukprot:7273419-Heterocapsa_arctica.AAC.1
MQAAGAVGLDCEAGSRSAPGCGQLGRRLAPRPPRWLPRRSTARTSSTARSPMALTSSGTACMGHP